MLPFPAARSFGCPLLVALLALACGGRDPILDRADSLDEPSGGASASGTAGNHGATAAAPPARGTPSEPAKVQPASPAPAAPGDPSPGQTEAPKPVQAQPPPPPGTVGGTTLAGTVVLPDYRSGTIRVDVFDGDQRAASGGGKRPGVVAMARLEAPGPFSVQVPADVREVWIGAYVDEDGDGRPGPLDPEVWYKGNPVDVSSGSPEVELVLVRREPPPKP
jgi:hypothetical protein